jgi:hypothetical protein
MSQTESQLLHNYSSPLQAMTTASVLSSFILSPVCAVICVFGHNSIHFALSGHTVILCLIDSVSFCYM